MPYQPPPPLQGGHPIANQPNQIIPPGGVFPQYVGAGAVGEYFYANPMMSPYNGDLTAYNPYRSLRRTRMKRRMEEMMLAQERMRALEMVEMMSMGGLGMGGMGMGGMGMGGMGMGGLGMGMGGLGMGGLGMGMGGLGMGMNRGVFMDDSYLMYGGGRFLGPCGYPHRRGIPCPECHDAYLV
jgi:hypothetical protein